MLAWLASRLVVPCGFKRDLIRHIPPTLLSPVVRVRRDVTRMGPLQALRMDRGIRSWELQYKTRVLLNVNRVVNIGHRQTR